MDTFIERTELLLRNQTDKDVGISMLNSTGRTVLLLSPKRIRDGTLMVCFIE